MASVVAVIERRSRPHERSRPDEQNDRYLTH
jgi:hypothetical protein